MQTLAILLRDLGFVLYGGPMVAFTLLIVFRGRLHDVDTRQLVRAYRAWGPGFGLALGATVLGALAEYYLRTGAFSWSWGSPAEQLSVAGWVTFLVMWASNVKLEVWTLEPLRKLDKGEETDPTAFEAATARLSRHMLLQALLIVAVVALSRVSGA